MNTMNKLYEFEHDQVASARLDRHLLERHEFIKSSLRLCGTSLAEVGRQLGVKNGTMTTVSKGLGSSKRIQLRLAEILQISPSSLWPENFSDPDEGESP